MSTEMAVWLRNCLYVSIAIVSRTRPSTGRSATQGRKVAERSLEGRVRGTPGQQGVTNTALHRSLGDPGPQGRRAIAGRPCSWDPRAARCHEHGPPPVARRSRSNRRPHPSSSSATALPVAQAAADRQVVLADRVPEVVVHRTDAALHPCCPLASHSGLSTLTGFAWSTANKQTWATYNLCVSTNPT